MSRIVYLFAVLLSMMGLQSCDLIAGIFKAGVWTGILVVVAVVGLIVWIIARLAGRK